MFWYILATAVADVVAGGSNVVPASILVVVVVVLVLGFRLVLAPVAVAVALAVAEPVAVAFAAAAAALVVGVVIAVAAPDRCGPSVLFVSSAQQFATCRTSFHMLMAAPARACLMAVKLIS